MTLAVEDWQMPKNSKGSDLAEDGRRIAFVVALWAG
jgi:hypothetical protein